MKKIIFAAIIVALFASCEANSPSNPKTNILAHATFRNETVIDMYRYESLLMFDQPYTGNVTITDKHIEIESGIMSGISELIWLYKFDGFIITMSHHNIYDNDTAYLYGAYRNDTVYFKNHAYTRVYD